jgi:hypothetical protein
MKILPMGAELFHADAQMDMTKLIVAFCNFKKAPENVKYFSVRSREIVENFLLTLI